MLNHIALCDDLLMREFEISLGNSPSRPDTERCYWDAARKIRL